MNTQNSERIQKIVNYGNSLGYTVQVFRTPGTVYVEGKKRVGGGVEKVNLGFIAYANGIV
jgi:hypothetical protein